MARQWNRSSSRIIPSSAKPCALRFFPRCLLCLQIMRKSGRSIGVNEYIPMWTKCVFLVRVFVNPVFPFAKANLDYLVKCCLEFLIIEDSHDCHVRFPKGPFSCQMTDSSNNMIQFEITSHGAGALLVADAHGLGTLPEVLPHIVLFLLHCQATLLLPNPNGFRCQLADSNTGILSPEEDSLSQHLDCIILCDDWFRQPEGITLQFRFATVVNDWVVGTKCWLLYSNVMSVE